MTYPQFTPDITQIPAIQQFAQADQVAKYNPGLQALQGPQFIVTIYNKFYGALGEVGDYISCNVTFKRNAVGTATLVLKGDDPYVQFAMQCNHTVVPITILVNGVRWSGRVDTCEDATVDGVNTVTLQLKQDWDWFNKMMVWPNFLLPIQVQFPKKAIFIGPAVTQIKTMISECTIRLQLGLWELVDNILDPMAWFGAALNGQGLLTPIAVIPTNPLLDTSKWTAVTARMESVATLVEQILKDEGLVLTADLWLPGEPQPTTAFTLTVPTIVVDVKDRSGITGPTGTFIDGLIQSVVEIATAAIGDIVNPLASSDYTGGADLSILRYLGYEWKPPWVIYFDGPRSGVKEARVTSHHPLAHTVLGGGKSPSWVNKLIDLVLELLISEALTALGATGISSTLLDGLFDDVFLAFQQVENEPRRLALGPYAHPEFFTQTGSTAYTLDEFVALESAMWDTRGYYSYMLVAQDGYPYKFGRDMNLGYPISWVYKGVMYTDYLTEANCVDDRQNRVQLTLKVGDNTAQDSPFAKMQRKWLSLADAVKTVTLSQ